MTDREMLELAAKAASIDAQWHDEDDPAYEAAHDGMWLKGARTHDNSKYWNPLTDDGDALRLAADLKINIFLAEAGFVTAGRSGIIGMREYVNDNLYAATRRAIVRAAAEIGKQMESQKK